MVAPLSEPPSANIFFLIENQSSVDLYERRQGSNEQVFFILIPNSTPTPIWSVGYYGESIPQIEDFFTNSDSEIGSFIYRRIDGNMVEALRWTDNNLNWEPVTIDNTTFKFILEITDEMIE